MDTGEGSSSAVLTREPTIQAGHTVLLKIPNGDTRSVKTEQNSVITLGRLGSFNANELIGKPYGLTFEIVGKTLQVVPPRSLQEVEDTDATNELINDGQFVQPLTLEEIEALKESGVHASDMIKMQIEQHANYSLKTEYSKEKYKKRKEAKYSKSFTTLEPTVFNVCEYWFAKDQSRIRDIRTDTLAQMLSIANVRPGGRYLVVDDASGLVLAGVLERMGGEGRVISVCDIDSPPAYPVMTHMNFPLSATAIHSSLNWATVKEEYTPLLDISDLPTEIRSERQRARLNKRKAAFDSLNNIRDELFGGEFDALLVASEYEPYSIIDQLFPYLGGSASIAVHSPHLQTLTDLQSQLRSVPQFLGPTVTEAWLRRYQVLPGRTHPMMTTSGTGGFLLHAIKVYDDPAASSIMAHRQRKAKRVKVEEPSAEEGSTAPKQAEQEQGHAGKDALVSSAHRHPSPAGSERGAAGASDLNGDVPMEESNPL
ncbi:hypothetical protein PLICRDRAFT_36512 [Plicaturopsis crispa FD-325 SS-3]|nr:hypothetical protein PLICRDRAFT_36512 [Plicaturopsis crispa FD-325 SS-3]